MAPFIFWNLAFYTIIRTQLEEAKFPFLDIMKVDMEKRNFKWMQ